MRPYLELAEVHLRTLYVADDAGRLVAETVDEGRVPPRFALVRTREGVIARVRNDVPRRIAGNLESLAQAEPPLADPDESPLGNYTELLAPVERTGGGPFYAFPDRIEDDRSVTELSSDMTHLIPVELGGPAGIADGKDLPAFALLVDGRAVSICRTARNVGDAAQAGVNTIEACRGRGYAECVVSAWGRHVRTQGLEPIYSTSYANSASRSVAAKAGLILAGVDLNFL